MTLDLTVNGKYNGTTFLEVIVGGDNLSMHLLLKQSDLNPKGKFPLDIMHPIFLADPSHRIKVMLKPYFKMVTKPKDLSKWKSVDALGINIVGMLHS